MYHATLAENHDSIMAQGLVASAPWGTDNPEGVYLYRTAADARNYSTQWDEPVAIYAVDTVGLTLVPDPLNVRDEAWIAPHVPADRLSVI